MGKAQINYASFNKRVASHSLTGTGGGKLLHLPASASEKETLYRKFDEQRGTAKANVARLEMEIADLKAQLAQKPKAWMAARLSDQLSMLGKQKLVAQSVLGDLNKTAMLAAEGSYGALFYALARMMLDRDVFIEVDNETKRLLGRDHSG